MRNNALQCGHIQRVTSRLVRPLEPVNAQPTISLQPPRTELCVWTQLDVSLAGPIKQKYGL